LKEQQVVLLKSDALGKKITPSGPDRERLKQYPANQFITQLGVLGAPDTTQNKFHRMSEGRF